MSNEECWLCDDFTGNAGRGDGSLYDADEGARTALSAGKS